MSTHEHSRNAWIGDLIYIFLGAFVSGFALRSFLVPAHFLDGGVTGVSLLIYELMHWNRVHTGILALLVILINLPLIIIGAYQLNRTFAIKTSIGVVLLALLLAFFPYPVLAFNDNELFSLGGDKLLVSVFGGFFLGLGIGLGMRGGCALDGIEVLAIYTLRRSSLSMSEVILGLNVIIFLIAAFGLGVSTALYAILTYFIATRTIDYVIEGLEEYTGVTIISGKSEEIKRALVMKLGRGITIYKGERGFMKESFEVSQPADIVFTVITRLEVRRLRNLVQAIDPRAFVFTNTIKEAAGGVLKRKASH